MKLELLEKNLVDWQVKDTKMVVAINSTLISAFSQVVPIKWNHAQMRCRLFYKNSCKTTSLSRNINVTCMQREKTFPF